jgi:hypothetical protein
MPRPPSFSHVAQATAGRQRLAASRREQYLEERQSLGGGSQRPRDCQIESPIPLSPRPEKARCSTATRSRKVWREIGDFDRRERVSRAASGLLTTSESSDKALNLIDKKPNLGICATVLGVLRTRTCRAIEASRGAGLAFHHKSRRGTGLGGQVTTGRKRGPDATPITKAQEHEWGGEPKPAVKGHAFRARLVSQGRPARHCPGRFFFSEASQA